MAWKKGQTGNKGGRGKGVKTYADHARKLCGDGLKISVFWYSIWTRNAKALKEFGIKADKITLDQQMDAAKRLYGNKTKAVGLVSLPSGRLVFHAPCPECQEIPGVRVRLDRRSAHFFF